MSPSTSVRCTRDRRRSDIGTDDTGTALLFTALVVLAVVIAFAMLFIFAQLTGWRTLVRRFGYTERFQGSFESIDGVLLGNHGWNAPPLRVGIDDGGIVLRPLAPLRGAFRIVRVPWDAIVSVEQRSFMFFDTTTLRYGAEPDAEISFVSGEIADAIAARRPPVTPSAAP